MGFWDWILNKKKEVPQMRQIKLNEVNEVILEKKKEMRNSEKVVLNTVNDKIRLLVGEFDEEFDAISKINLEKRKAEAKLKIVVKNNLDEFVLCLRKLKTNLENLKAERLDELIQKINFNFYDFKSKSRINFEKATFLVGDELGKVMESIKRFHEELNQLLEENKELFNGFGTIEKVEILMIQLSQIEKIKKEIEQEIKNDKEELGELEGEIKGLRKNIGNITISEKYQEKAEKRQEVEARNEKLKKKIANLSEIIDLKELARIHHSNEKEMRVINNYKENFNRAFGEDNGESLLKIVKNEARYALQEEISRITKEKKEISEILVESDDILEIEGEICKIENKISETKVENMKREKKVSQLDDKAGEVRETLKSELAGIKIELSN